jgi:anti-anti-sigma factor
VPSDPSAGGLSSGPAGAYREPVRAHGPVTEVPEAGTTDHVCWVYDADDDFDEVVRRFLAGGLERGERLLCVGDRVIQGLRGDSAELGDVDALIADGTLETLRLTDAYDADAGLVPEAQLAYYDAATRRALADGYRGLRVVAELSAIAADPVRRPELVRWEHLADGYIASGSGFTAMCAYSSELTRAVWDELASVHPQVRTPGGAPPFQVFFAGDGGGTVVAGSIDTYSAERLARVLASSPAHRAPVVLDLARVEFMDVAACRVLARWARDLQARSLPVQVTGASALVRRLWQLLSLDTVAPVTFTEPRA